MHLNFQRNHLQLFFVTLILEGRPAVLSELVEGEKRTKLTPLGEVVKAALLEISSRFPGVGTSEFAIMPDHLHFILIFDYRRAAKGGVPLCGFISPGEREFERRLKALPRSRWIKAVPYGLPPRFDPSVEDSEHLAAHRELILSAFDPADFAPFKVTRARCLAMNDRLVEIAEESTGLRPEPRVN